MNICNSKKILLSFAVTISVSFLFSQKNIKLYTVKTTDGFDVFADNNEIFTVSVALDFKLNNLLNYCTNNTFVLPPNSIQQLLTHLQIEDKRSRSNYSYKYLSCIGDLLNQNFDTNYNYNLPFEKGNSYYVSQGYDGKVSHQNENSLDFTVPIGTKVCAARAGLVIQVVDNHNENCLDKSCMEFNNYITIQHSDGSFAKYTHLDFKGAKVNIGDSVVTGQTIALSGNTGFSTGPHLHIEINVPSIKKKQTLPTKFRVGDGTDSIYLQEGVYYVKNY